MGNTEKSLCKREKRDSIQFPNKFEFEFNTSSCENKCLKAQMHMYII